jgi:hypothetical protein
MRFGWETEKQKVLRRAKIPAARKLEAARLMNEFADSVLSTRQKLIRQKLRQVS